MTELEDALLENFTDEDVERSELLEMISQWSILDLRRLVEAKKSFENKV